MNTTKILEQTQKLVSDDRAKKHGDKVDNHENIARLWTGYIQNKTKLAITILPEDVANLMSLLKIARTQAGEHNLDDYVDACGYSAIAGEIANKTMPKEIKVPIISKELVEYLDILFPEKCADLNDNEKQTFYKSGQRSVVNHLIEKYKIQEE